MRQETAPVIRMVNRPFLKPANEEGLNRGPKLVNLPMEHLIGPNAVQIYDFYYTENLKFPLSPIIINHNAIERGLEGRP